MESMTTGINENLIDAGTGTSKSSPLLSSNLRSRYRLENDRLVIELPESFELAGFFAGMYFIALMLIGIPIYILALGSHPEDGIVIAIPCAVGLFFLCYFYLHGPLGFIAPSRTTLDVGVENLGISRRSLRRFTKQTIEIADIRKLELEESWIVIKMPNSAVRVYCNVSESELNSIKTILDRVLLTRCQMTNMTVDL